MLSANSPDIASLVDTGINNGFNQVLSIFADYIWVVIVLFIFIGIDVWVKSKKFSRFLICLAVGVVLYGILWVVL